MRRCALFACNRSIPGRIFSWPAGFDVMPRKACFLLFTCYFINKTRRFCKGGSRCPKMSEQLTLLRAFFGQEHLYLPITSNDGAFLASRICGELPYLRCQHTMKPSYFVAQHRANTPSCNPLFVWLVDAVLLPPPGIRN